MIPEIIEQMRKELYDTKLCISDFEKYDLKTLEKTNEPFFWLVRTHGTHLCFIGPSVESLFSSESNRFAIMKDSLAIIASIVYWDDLDYNKYFIGMEHNFKKYLKIRLFQYSIISGEAGYINFPFNTLKSMQP